ncbi:MAG: hypothetical protein KJP02_07945 [Octadecabacter sp.]|nr:hypothetical protein [Octadecabacter sp.]
MPAFADNEVGSSVRTKINDSIALAESAVQPGFWGWQDWSNAGAAQALTVADTFYRLENDGAGAQTTTTYKVPGHGDIWDATNDELDFSDLAIGDEVTVRFDIEIVTGGTNRELTLRGAFGSASPFTINLGSYAFRDAGTHYIVTQKSFYIGSADVRDNPGVIEIASADTGDTARVNGFYVKTLIR